MKNASCPHIWVLFGFGLKKDDSATASLYYMLAWSNIMDYGWVWDSSSKHQPLWADPVSKA